MPNTNAMRTWPVRLILAAALAGQTALAQAQPAVVHHDPAPAISALSGTVQPLQIEDCHSFNIAHANVVPTATIITSADGHTPPYSAILFIIVADGEYLGRVPTGDQAQQVIRTIVKYGLTQRCMVGRQSAHPMVYYKANGDVPVHQGDDGACRDYRANGLFYVDHAFGDWYIIYGPHEQVSQGRVRGDLVEFFGPVESTPGKVDANHENALAGLAIMRKYRLTRSCAIGASGFDSESRRWSLWLR